MSRKIRLIIMALLLAVFCAAGGVILYTQYKYEKEDKVYEQAAEEFTHRVENTGTTGTSGTTGEAGMAGPDIPLKVDFEKLRETNSDVVGWIYCEDTAINYPILQGSDNDYYLRRNLNQEHQTAGSIFMESTNHPGFADSNTIIYGHHMKNGSMFACLDEWADQAFYETHPVMWLLTPEQDYQILLFAGYTTPATSDTYITFDGPCQELEEYLDRCLKQSDFQADFDILGETALDPDGRYVVLSTCAYNFKDARYVLHGKLVPVEK